LRSKSHFWRDQVVVRLTKGEQAMKVIVKESGFYGGTYYIAKAAEQEMPDAVARPFMAPYGHQLVKPSDRQKAIRPVKE